MSVKKWVILGVLLAMAGVLVALVVGLPIIRTAGYRAIISEYASAAPLQLASDANQSRVWDVSLLLANGAQVRVRALDHMSVVTVQYADEAAPKALYDYEDYSNPEAIRSAGHKLFVYWSETLLHTDWWLLAYDLENRREIERRRVDPRDMLPIR